MRELWQAIEQLDNRVAAATQYAMTQDTVALIRQVDLLADPAPPRRARHRGAGRAAASRHPRARGGAAAVAARARARGVRPQRCAPDSTAGVPAALARHVAACAALASAPDIVELAQAHRLSVAAAARTYFGVGSEFGLDWLRDRIEELDIQGHWQAVARGSLREALYDAHRGLTQRVLERDRASATRRAPCRRGASKHAAAAAHARGVVDDIRAQPSVADFASLSVALQALRRLAVAER